MATGILRVQSFAARQSAPIPEATVTVAGAELYTTFMTDAEGNAPDLMIEAPSRSYSLDPDNTTVLPYSTCTITAVKAGYEPIRITGVQIFEGEVTLAELEFTPVSGDTAVISEEVVNIPVHALFAGNGGSGPAPVDDGTAGRILPAVVIPKNITVHLGRPAVSAANVTVSFRKYIANVASSEVYPTWPEQALRANIHCQISLALNRIYTEWYPSKGYTFNITNSTSYDQYYVHGRTVFDVMVKLTDDIFNTYVRKSGTVNPFYTEYCDGKSVSCPGLKQWGTVDLANRGYSALQILRYYYGNNTEIIRTNNIQSIPESYPGSPLREGSRGTAVYTLQRQLNRITKDYPFLGTLTVDGIFGPQMTETVKKFQKQFNLTADGVVGRSTWYKISYIYASVKDLAELTSEGETSSGTVSGGTWGGVTLRVGSSGAAVQQLQFWLNVLAQFNSSIPSVTVDGNFGSGTRAAVIAFQRKFGLTADGLVGRATWDAIYRQYRSAQSDTGNGSAYPGTPLREGSSGSAVKLVQFWLRMARTNYSSLNNVTVDGVYGSSTAAAVRRFQNYFGLTADGVVGRSTWNKLYEVYTGVANRLLDPSLRPGQFPGTLRRGSSGTRVRELQYYLYILSAYNQSIPSVSIDGSFGSSTEAAVRAFQRLNGLQADGVVGQATWTALYAQASRLRLSGPVITVEQMPYPGEPFVLNEMSDEVRYYNTLLARIAFYYPSVEEPGTGDVFTPESEQATKSLQLLLGLAPTGKVTAETWKGAEELSLSLLADAPAGNTEPDTAPTYPGRALRQTCRGKEVCRLQQLLNQIALLYIRAACVPCGGVFDADVAAAVENVQLECELPVNGIVDRETWAAICTMSSGAYLPGHPDAGEADEEPNETEGRDEWHDC